MKPQTAYKIHYDDIRHGAYSSTYVSELTLPQINCTVCGAISESIQHAWYPTLFPHINEIKLVVSEMAGDVAIVSTECFREIRSKIRQITKRDLWLPGGSRLGKIQVKIKSFNRPKKLQEKFKKLPDLLGRGANILLSSNSIKALKSKGFNIPSDPVVLTWNGLVREDYLAVELEPRTLFASSGQEAWDSWVCDFCGDGHLKQPLRREANPQWVEYDLNVFPEWIGISRLRESFSTLASEDFKFAVDTLGLSGFKFYECGKFMKGS